MADGNEPTEAAKKKIKKANKVLNEGKHEQGLTLLNDAIQLCPDNVEYLLKRGSTFLSQKMCKEAMRDAILCRTLEPQNIAAAILLAECHRAYGSFVLAEDVLQVFDDNATGKIEPLLRSLEDLQLDATRLQKLHHEQKFADANSLCNQLLLVAPECYTTKFIKCLSLTMMGHHTEAGKMADSLLEVNPCDCGALFAKAQLLYYIEEYYEAGVMLKQIELRSPPEVGHLAEAALKRVVTFVQANESAEAAAEGKDYRTAIERYEDALKIDVKHNLANSRTHLLLSMVHAKKRNLFKSLDHCELAIQLDNTNEQAIIERIGLLEELNFAAEALEQTKRITTLRDDKSRIERLEAAVSLSKSQGHYYVLSIQSRATVFEIRAAYEGKMKYFGSCDSLSIVEDKMKLKRKEIDEAYSVLTDEKKRSLYDHEIGISRCGQDLSGSDDEFLAKLKWASKKKYMSASRTRSMLSLSRPNAIECKENVVSQDQKRDDSLSGREKKEDHDIDKKGDLADALTGSSEIVPDKEEKNYGEAPTLGNTEKQEPVMSQREKEAQQKYSDGIMEFNQQNYHEAAEAFTVAISLHSTNVKYHASRSDSYLKIMKYSEALEDACRVVSLEGESVNACLRIMKCQLMFGNIVEAEKMVTCIDRLDPVTSKQWSAHLNTLEKKIAVTRVRFANSDFSATIELCDAILETSPEFLEIKLLKAEALTRLNDFQQADDIVADLIDNDEAKQGVLYIRGLLAYYKNDLDVSLKILADVETKYGQHPESKMQAVKIRLLKRNKDEGNEAFKASCYEEACAKYTKALSFDRTNKLTNATLYLNRAKAKFKLGHIDEAKYDCDQAIALDVKYEKAYFKRAEIHTELEMFEEAVADWEIVCETNASASNVQGLDNAVKKMNEITRKPFAVLGISATATADEIKEARHRLVLIHHPDKHPTELAPIRKMHERKFKAVQEAFKAMSNSEAEAAEPEIFASNVYREDMFEHHAYREESFEFREESSESREEETFEYREEGSYGYRGGYSSDRRERQSETSHVYGDDCQVHVTGFDDEVTEEDLERKMANHGEVIAVTIRSAGTKRYAFVTFAKAENALKVQSAIISFNSMKLTIRPKTSTARDGARSHISGRRRGGFRNLSDRRDSFEFRY
ncbi:DnaJ -like protein subfamily C member 7 [Halotydeus destructor]|nr:DnaJ -like protein subfamily C member 7 [Halotydeus destructor]